MYIGTNVSDKRAAPLLRLMPAELMVRPLHCSVSANDIFYYYYLFITCSWVDTRWQESLHVTLAQTMKILL